MMKPTNKNIKKAASIIRKGELVAFPTETVYGLGANAISSKAVKKIFIAKKRPADNPLIVHISNKNDIYLLAREVPKEAIKLIKKYWPGPLTIVLKKSLIVPPEVTCNLDTVAIRVPQNKIALSLIEQAQVPIAAPSANISGKPSPTCAKHVAQDFKNKIFVLDGGSTKIGLESTVIDLSKKPFTLLRPGKITLEELKKILGKVVVARHNSKKPKSPGMKYRHYSPKAKLILIEGERNKVEEKIRSILTKDCGVLGVNIKIKSKKTINLGKDHRTIASNLYSALREFDDSKITTILAQGTEDKLLGRAIMNRLRKAATKIIKV